jgi:hypothetical protein
VFACPHIHLYHRSLIDSNFDFFESLGSPAIEHNNNNNHNDDDDDDDDALRSFSSSDDVAGVAATTLPLSTLHYNKQLPPLMFPPPPPLAPFVKLEPTTPKPIVCQQPTMQQLTIVRQGSVSLCDYHSNGQHTTLHVCVKNSPFEIDLSLAEPLNDNCQTPLVAMRELTLHATLVYDRVDNEAVPREVPQLRDTRPLKFEVSSKANVATMRVRINALTSKNENVTLYYSRGVIDV